MQYHAFPEDEMNIVCAVSGGSDSTFLLCVLATLFSPEKIHGVYINHMLRPDETTGEIAHVRKLCDSLGTSFTSFTVNTPEFAQENKLSIEAAARELRYRKLENFRKKNSFDYIAVGHNADDQAEEVLIRMIRGTGLKGLGGMQFLNGKIIRPLLTIRKNELETFLRQENISWCYDSSNADLSCLRNRIRHQLLPQLEEDFNPGIRNTILHTADILREDEQCLAAYTEKGFSASVTPGSNDTALLTINTRAILQYPTTIQRRIIEKCFWIADTRPDYHAIIKVLELIRGNEANKVAKELHFKDGLRVLVKNNQCFFTNPFTRDETNKRGSTGKMSNTWTPILIQKPGSVYIRELDVTLEISPSPPPSGHNLLIAAEKVCFPLMVRPCLSGEKFSPARSTGSKKISRYFNEKKIPQQQRATWPILYQQERVVAVTGLDVDRTFTLDNSSQNALFITVKKGNET